MTKPFSTATTSGARRQTRMTEEPILDCCERPDLRDVRTLTDTTHESEVLRQCRSCEACWFYRFHEHVSYQGDDDITQWYTRVTPDEALSIMQAETRPDLSFLSERSSFMIDRHGVSKVDGQPTEPWGY
jgi:hypothetical protein